MWQKIIRDKKFTYGLKQMLFWVTVPIFTIAEIILTFHDRIRLPSAMRDEAMNMQKRFPFLFLKLFQHFHKQDPVDLILYYTQPMLPGSYWPALLSVESTPFHREMGGRGVWAELHPFLNREMSGIVQLSHALTLMCILGRGSIQCAFIGILFSQILIITEISFPL